MIVNTGTLEQRIASVRVIMFMLRSVFCSAVLRVALNTAHEGSIKVIRINSLAAIAATLSALCLLPGCAKQEAGGPPPPPQVTVAEVLQKPVKDWDEFTGRLQAVETVEIRPRVSGYIDKVAFTEAERAKSLR